MEDRLVESVRGHEQILADRRREIAQLGVGDEDDAQVDRVDLEVRGNRHDERHDDDDRREDVHHAADDDQKRVQAEQEHPLRVDVRLAHSASRAGTCASIR